MGRKIVLDKKIGTSVALSSKAISIMDKERGQNSRSSYIEKLVIERSGVRV
jgi:hypothetical protein